MGTKQTVYNGVSLLGIPLHPCLYYNIEVFVAKGIADKMNYYSVSRNCVTCTKADSAKFYVRYIRVQAFCLKFNSSYDT